MSKRVEPDSLGQAIIEDGYIVIRVKIKHLPTIVKAACEMQWIEVPFRVIDSNVFAQEVVRAINDEDEQGTTAFHTMFDRACEAAVDAGAEGVKMRSLRRHPDLKIRLA